MNIGGSGDNINKLKGNYKSGETTRQAESKAQGFVVSTDASNIEGTEKVTKFSKNPEMQNFVTQGKEKFSALRQKKIKQIKATAEVEQASVKETRAPKLSATEEKFLQKTPVKAEDLPEANFGPLPAPPQIEDAGEDFFVEAKAKAEEALAFTPEAKLESEVHEILQKFDEDKNVDIKDLTALRKNCEEILQNDDPNIDRSFYEDVSQWAGERIVGFEEEGWILPDTDFEEPTTTSPKGILKEPNTKFPEEDVDFENKKSTGKKVSFASDTISLPSETKAASKSSSSMKTKSEIKRNKIPSMSEFATKVDEFFRNLFPSISTITKGMKSAGKRLKKKVEDIDQSIGDITLRRKDVEVRNPVDIKDSRHIREMQKQDEKTPLGKAKNIFRRVREKVKKDQLKASGEVKKIRFGKVKPLTTEEKGGEYARRIAKMKDEADAVLEELKEAEMNHDEWMELLTGFEERANVYKSSEKAEFVRVANFLKDKIEETK